MTDPRVVCVPRGNAPSCETGIDILGVAGMADERR